MSTSIQSSKFVTLQDSQGVSPATPSLQELQQAVQEALEHVEGRGAGEVLKDLLERVVEATLGQAEGGGEEKVNDMLGEIESGKEAAEEEANGVDMGGEGRDTDVEGEEQAEHVNRFEDVAAEKGVVKGEAETATGPVAEVVSDLETGGREAEEVESIDESPDTEVICEVVEETVAVSEETGGYAAVQEAGADGNKRQIELSEGKVIAEANALVEESPADVEVGVGLESELETGIESDPSHVVEKMKGTCQYHFQITNGDQN